MARSWLILLFSLLLATPALASGKSKGSDKEAKPGGQYIDLSAVAMPIIVNRRLVNYVFVSARIILRDGADTPKIREKEPYFRDALVRAGHRTPYNSGVDYTSIDVKKLEENLYRDAVSIAGAKDVKGAKVMSQTPKTRFGLPPIGPVSSVQVAKP